jgi:hypothetical protein
MNDKMPLNPAAMHIKCDACVAMLYKCGFGYVSSYALSNCFTRGHRPLSCSPRSRPTSRRPSSLAPQRRPLSIPATGSVQFWEKKKKKEAKGIEKKKTYAPRRLGLLPVHLGKHLAEERLKRPVLGPLVELAHEVAAGLEGLGRKGQGGVAEVLFCWEGVSFVSGGKG